MLSLLELSFFPQWFLEYEHAEIYYSALSFKTSIPNINRRFEKFEDTLPGNYFSYLDDVNIDDATAMTSSAYYSFLENYFIRNIPEKLDKLSGFQRSSQIRTYMVSQSTNELTGDVKNNFQKYLFAYLLKYYSDRTEIDSLAKAFEVEEYEELLSLSGTKSKGNIELMYLTKGDTIPNFYVTTKSDSLISLMGFSDKIVYVNFWASWCGPCVKNIPELNQMISQYTNNPEIVFLNVSLDVDKDKWLSSMIKHKLKGVNVLAQGNWIKLLKAIFNITGIPQYAIIGKGNVLIENHTDKAPSVGIKLDDLLK